MGDFKIVKDNKIQKYIETYDILNKKRLGKMPLLGIGM